MAPSLVFVGNTCGQGAGEAHATPDVTGWTTSYKAIGPGAPGSAGRAYATCIKYFRSTAEGYPNFPTSWSQHSNLNNIINNNGGVAIVPIIVFGSGAGSPSLTPPSVATIQSYIGSVPANQKVCFQYVSEAESGSDIGGGAYVNNSIIFSNNLNTALANLGGGANFNRQRFMFVNSARMDHYQSSPGDTSYVPPLGVLDSYGADFYQHIGGTQSVGLQNDPRYQGYLLAIHNKTGSGTATVPNVSLSLPEYGIGFGSYTAANEQARANLLAKDFAYMSGANSPAGASNSILFWNYWWQMDASPNFYCFPLQNGTETEAQGGPTISVWQSIISAATGGGGGGAVNVVGVAANINTVAQSPSSFGGSFFVRSMNGATTGAATQSTLNVLKDPQTKPGDLIQIWVATNTSTGLTFSCPGFTATPAVN